VTGPVLPVRGAGVGGDPAGIGPDNPKQPKKDGNFRSQGVNDPVHIHQSFEHSSP